MHYYLAPLPYRLLAPRNPRSILKADLNRLSEVDERLGDHAALREYLGELERDQGRALLLLLEGPLEQRHRPRRVVQVPVEEAQRGVGEGRVELEGEGLEEHLLRDKQVA